MAANDFIIEEDNIKRPNAISRSLSWRPTSAAELKDAENIILSKLTIPYKTFFIPINNDTYIRAISCGISSDSTPPLLMLHGMASGIALWILNLEALCINRQVIAIDLLGFGRSSRSKFPISAEDIEETYVNSIDECVKKLNLPKFILLGHSFGAFLAAAYSLRHADKLKSTVLCDPWGFPEKPQDVDQLSWAPAWKRAVASVLIPFNPLASVRVFGRFGPGLIERFRQDISIKYEGVIDAKDVYNYIYHCNAQKPSGETAFRRLSIPVGWAKNPMISRIDKIDKNLPLYFIHGSKSWIDTNTGFKVQDIRAGSVVHVRMVQGAGHHVYSDQAAQFNRIVNEICATDDENDHQPK